MFFVIANHFSQQLRRGGNLVQREEPLAPLRVVGLDGKHVVMVDHLADRIILSKEQPASSQFSIDWVDYVDQKVHLNKPSTKEWQAAV
jgi:hypothetical protein